MWAHKKYLQYCDPGWRDGWGHNYDDWRVQIRPCWALFRGLGLFAKRPLHPVIKDYDPRFMAYRLSVEWASIQVVWPSLPQALSLSLLWIPPCLEQTRARLASQSHSEISSHLWTTSANIYLLLSSSPLISALRFSFEKVGIFHVVSNNNNNNTYLTLCPSMMLLHASFLWLKLFSLSLSFSGSTRGI